jgi:hypothetical protein
MMESGLLNQYAITIEQLYREEENEEDETGGLNPQI